MREFTRDEQLTLEFLGDFEPTMNPTQCTIKGYTNGSKTYLTSSDLYNMSKDLNSIAQWLDDRLTEHENNNEG